MINNLLESNTKKCLEFMQDILKQEQPITAISSLPFSKKIMKQKIMELAKSNSADTIENKARIRMYFLMLSTCISDDDAMHWPGPRISYTNLV